MNAMPIRDNPRETHDRAFRPQVTGADIAALLHPACAARDITMIHILDEIVLAPRHLATVLSLLESQYLPGSAARGLALLQRWVSPPVALEDAPNTLWLLWQVADAPAYYAMRASIDAPALAFWSTVSTLCDTRRRHVMADAACGLPQRKEPCDAA